MKGDAGGEVVNCSNMALLVCALWSLACTYDEEQVDPHPQNSTLHKRVFVSVIS